MNVVQIIEEFEFFMLLLVYIFFLAILRLCEELGNGVDVVTRNVDDLHTHLDVLLDAMLPVVLHVLTQLDINLHILHDLVENFGRLGDSSIKLIDFKLSQHISERLESFESDALSMLAKIYHDLMALGNAEAIRIHRSILAFLLCQLHPCVSYKTQKVSLKEVSHVIADVVGFKVFFNTTDYAVVVLEWCRRMDIFWLDIIEETFLPHDEVDVAVKITARHLIGIWSLSFG